MSDIKNDGGPAFQHLAPHPAGIIAAQVMTLRDWFAGMALPSLIEHMEKPTPENSQALVSALCGAAYTIADAMIKQREL